MTDLEAARLLIRHLESERDHYRAAVVDMARQPHAPRYEPRCLVCKAQMCIKAWEKQGRDDGG